MAMNYTIYDKTYSFSYKEIQNDYNFFCALSDKEFIDNLKIILHFACFVSWLKELPINDTLSDEGIVHKLVHLTCLDEPLVDLKEIREQFNDLLEIK